MPYEVMNLEVFNQRLLDYFHRIYVINFCTLCVKPPRT